MKVNQRAILYAAALLFVGIAVLAYLLKDTTGVERSNEKSLVDKIEADLALKLPPNKIIKFEDNGSIIDPSWVAHIVISREFLDNLKNEIDKKQDDNTDLFGAFSERVSWWRPQSIIISKQYLADRSTLINIILSENDEKSFSMFVECDIF